MSRLAHLFTKIYWWIQGIRKNENPPPSILLKPQPFDSPACWYLGSTSEASLPSLVLQGFGVHCEPCKARSTPFSFQFLGLLTRAPFHWLCPDLLKPLGSVGQGLQNTGKWSHLLTTEAAVTTLLFHLMNLSRTSTVHSSLVPQELGSLTAAWSLTC